MTEIDQPPLAPGQAVEIELPDDPDRPPLHSRVEEVGDDGFTVRMPLTRGPAVTLRDEMPLIVHCLDEHGLCTFTTKVLSAGPAPGIRLARPGPVAREQRRGYFRLPAQVTVSYGVVDGTGRCQGESATLDMSGGGIRFEIAGGLSVGDLLAIDVGIGGDGILAEGEVVRVGRIPGGTGQVVAVRFTEISEGDRERIIRFLFRVERELARRRRDEA